MTTQTQSIKVREALDAASAELERHASKSPKIAAEVEGALETLTTHVRELRGAVEAVQAAAGSARVDREAVQRRDAALEALHVAQLLVNKRKHPRGPVPPEVVAARARLEEAERALLDAPRLGEADRARIAAAVNRALGAVEVLRSGAVGPLAGVRGMLNDCELALGRL
jgi:hypothetical protein